MLLLRVLILVAVVGAFASAFAGAGADPVPAGATVAVWCTDREGDRVVGLDAGLRVALDVPVDHPRAISAFRGGAWVTGGGFHCILESTKDTPLSANIVVVPIDLVQQ